jgi:minor extracellular serine protease Vpr
MKSVKIVNVLAIAIALPILAGAAQHRFIVEFSTEPAAVFAARNFGERKESLARPEVKAHRDKIRAEQDAAISQIQQLGGRVVARTATTSNSAIVDLPEENAAKLSAIPGVKAYHKERKFKVALDQANIVHKFPQAYSQVGGPANAGAGIKIAVIDTGIDITQPAFSDSGFTAPAGFPVAGASSDLKYTNNKVIVARSYVNLLNPPSGTGEPAEFDFSASDEQGHGTITSDCAGGGPTVTTSVTFTGGAPGAYLGNYKVFGTPGTASDFADNEGAILQAIEDVVSDGMDVINFSLGGFPPIPATTDSVAQALNNAVKSGVVVAAAAGNDGNGLEIPLFYDSADLAAPTIPELISTDGAQNVIQVGASSNQRAFGPDLIVGPSQFLLDTEYAVTTDLNNNNLVYSNAPIIDVATIDGTGQACNTLPAGSLKGAIGLVTLNGFDPNQDTCDPDQKFDNMLAAGAVAGVISDNFPEDFEDIFDYYGAIVGYQFLSNTNLPGGFITYYDGTLLRQQLAAQSGNTATMDFNTYAVPLSSDRVAFLSSRGPNADFEIKPDLVAVGEDLFTATQTVNPCDPTQVSGCFYDPSGTYYPANGTSGATPLVAGAAALLKGARPGLTALQYRSLIVNSAGPIHDVVNGGLARVFDAGSGILDVNAALNAEAVLVPASLSFGTGDGSTTLTKSFTVTNIGSAADTFKVIVTPRDPGFTPNVDQTSLNLGPGQSATVNVSVPGGVVGSGEYEGAIHIQGNNTATDTHLMYWFGVPSSTPYLLTDMGSDTADTHGQTIPAAVIFRITDGSGIYMSNILSQVTVTYNGSYDSNGNAVKNGNASVGKVYKYDQYSPGTIAADVKVSTRVNLFDDFTVTIGDPNNPTLSLDFFIFTQ